MRRESVANLHEYKILSFVIIDFFLIYIYIYIYISVQCERIAEKDTETGKQKNVFNKYFVFLTTAAECCRSDTISSSMRVYRVVRCSASRRDKRVVSTIANYRCVLNKFITSSCSALHIIF